MTIQELKALSPNAKPYQFEQHGSFKVGDKVDFIFGGKHCSAIIQRFFNAEHGMSSYKLENTSVRVVDEDGQLAAWLNISNYTITTPETATSGEGQNTTQP